MSETEHKIKITTEFQDDASKGFKQAQGALLDFSKAAEKAGKVISKSLGEDQKKVVEKNKSLIDSFTALKASTLAAVAGFASIGLAIKNMITAYAESDLSVKKLNDSLKNAGVFSAAYSKHLQEQALSIQKTTRFSDEQVMSVQQLLITYGVYGTMLDKTTKAAIDLAEVTDKDVNGAAFALSKAIGGNTEMLSRYGIKIDENIPKSERFALAIKLITEKMGGRAEGAGDTLSGSMTIAKNAIGELMEKGGEFIVMTTSLVKYLKMTAEGFDILRIAMGGGTQEEATQKLITSLMRLEDTIQKHSVGLMGAEAENAAIQLKKVHAQILELIGKKEKLQKLDVESVGIANKKFEATQKQLKKEEETAKYVEAHKDDKKKFEDLKNQAISEMSSTSEQIELETKLRIDAINKLTEVDKQQRADLIEFEYDLRDKKMRDLNDKEKKESAKKTFDDVSGKVDDVKGVLSGNIGSTISGGASLMGASATNPYVAIAAAVGELVIHSKAIPGKIDGMMKGLLDGMSKGVPALMDYLSGKFISDLMTKFIPGMLQALIKMLPAIMTMMTQVLFTVLKNLPSMLTGLVKGIGSGIVDGIKSIGSMFGGLFGGGPSPQEKLEMVMKELSGHIQELNRTLNQTFRSIVSSISSPAGQLNIARGDLSGLKSDRSDLLKQIREAGRAGDADKVKELLSALAQTQADMMNKAKDVYDLETAQLTRIYEKKKELYQKERGILVDRINELKNLRNSATDAIKSAKEAILTGSLTSFQNTDRIRQNYANASSPQQRSEAASKLAGGLQAEFEAAQSLASQGAISGEEFQTRRSGILSELDATQSQVQSQFDQMIQAQRDQIKVLDAGFKRVSDVYKNEMAKLRDALLAVVKALSKLPKYDSGTPYVPQTGLALVHQGEAIIPAAYNRGGSSGMTFNINGVGASGMTKEALTKAVRDILNQNIGNFKGALQKATG